ncbi:MoaD/ThiS family protein [Tautonia plasticadhaerens]|uniref:Molybdopterin synthase sulfur carrier subunit n=1 Tax=Tautonia plasticadhaerens TaxID=2527974 RepID=A0A518HBC6_9BACT|nr:MoaD/ThiS family protein [Tautonia plasticadhaerens]QDV38127.1 molybdopterin synthase small subunit [Tautonia plasticadhaerens]
MLVKIRLFAVARQRLGSPEVGVELPEPATVATLRTAVAEQHPALAALMPGMMVAVEGEYAAEDREIRAGQEVALIPPVSGGAVHDRRAAGNR